MELAGCARRDPALRAPHRRRARERLARADARLGRSRPARRRRRRLARDPRRLRRRGLGRASTTSRSSPTTVPSATRIPTRSGISTPPSSRAAVGTLSSAAGRKGGSRRKPRAGEEKHEGRQPGALGARDRCRCGARARRGRRGSYTFCGERADRHRLGARQQRADGAVRRAGARRGASIELNKVNKKGVHRPQDRAQDVRHAERRPDGLEGVRRPADQPGREDHLHDVRRRSRRAGRAGVRSTHHLLTVAPCIGTDQMGPKRFGTAGKLAFSFGNVAQDEGSAMAAGRLEARLEDGRPREGHGDRLLQGRRERLQGALQAAGRQDQVRDDVPGLAPSAATTSRTPSPGSTRIKADVIVTVTAGAYGSLGPFITGHAHGGEQDACPQLVGR